VYSGNRLSSLSGSSSYGYDGNGNTTYDGKRGIGVGYFEEIDLPEHYARGTDTVRYEYDATGLKWGKSATLGGNTSTMDYYGEFIYRDGTLDRVLTSEGYYDPTGADYHYHLKDHLGNTRMTIHYDGSSATAQVDQEIEYYPFGKMFSANNTAENKYLYNGKELQNEFFENYDYGARFYDPELARFHTIDPMAHLRESLTPYNFVSNNPIIRIDPTGALDGDYYDTDGNYLGNDGIDDDKVYTVEGTSKFNVSDFGEGGKYHNNETAYNENNGDGFSVTYEGQVSDVFVTGDAPSDSRIQSLHPTIRMKATNFIRDANASSGNTLIRVAQGYRTFAEQDALYEKGRTAGGSIVTNARGGYSNHNFGLAFDIVGITNGKIDYNLDWSGLSTLGKAQGFEWGGDWKFSDKPHFQNMFGNSVKSLREKYNSGNLTNGYINLR
jgi:RHS repeat-associated protein